MHRARGAVLVASLAVLPGCVAAGAAAAGAGTGIYLTSRGAESTIKGNIDNVSARVKQVFTSEGITMNASSAENDQNKKSREYKGTKGNLDITASLSSADSGTTKVEVSARKSTVEWDKDYAQKLLNEIVKQPS
jgi:peroxiredoxin family protein